MASQVDHLVIEAYDPSPLFELFSVHLGLPVAWPLKDSGDYVSGAVWLGNITLEIVRFRTNRFGRPTDTQSIFTGGAVLTGLALEPNATGDNMLADLQSLGVDNRPGGVHEQSTQTLLDGLVDEPAVVYMCEYTHDYLTQRVQLAGQMMDSRGGVLGIDWVSAVEIGIRLPLRDEESAWGRLLRASLDNTDTVSLPDGGPTLRFQQFDVAALLGFTVKVKSLAAALEALPRVGLTAGPRDAHGAVTVVSDDLDGVVMKLL